MVVLPELLDSFTFVRLGLLLLSAMMRRWRDEVERICASKIARIEMGRSCSREITDAKGSDGWLQNTDAPAKIVRGGMGRDEGRCEEGHAIAQAL
eukprot:2694851-Rhodomonas_salina.1